MVRQGTVFGHIVSSKGLEVDKAKIYVIVNLPVPKILTFFWHASFYKRFIKDFNVMTIIQPSAKGSKI